MANSITKTHSDWLSLIEISGPFVSIPILADAFPQGVEDVAPEAARSLKADYEFWQENADDPAVHSAWVRLVLESLLGYATVETEDVLSVLLSGQGIPAGLKAEFPEHEETVRPDLVLVEPSAVDGGQLTVGSGERKPRLLIQVFPRRQDLGKAVIGSRWAASVGTRLMELCHATEIPLGLATNGEQWMLVFAPRGETTGFTTWYASLWFEERATLNAFQSLLGVKRFFGVEENETLEALLKRSADNQQEITDQLGLQVRHAVEILIQSLDKADQERGGKLLGADISPDLLYEAALTVMMRLVFMLSAEERKLLPMDSLLYSENYAVSTLREQLMKQAELGEEVLEYRYDAWSRLLAAFRAVFGGIRHQDLNLPAYGGSLFNPDKYPFLEGREKRAESSGKALTPSPSPNSGRGEKKRGEAPLPISNRTVLHLLNALQMLQVDGELRRLSFRALDVEQIGHVYEGLLDHKATRAEETMLGLGGAKRLEPEIALSKLEQARAGGEASLGALLKDETQRSAAALKNALAIDIRKEALKLERLRAACGNDEALLGRILPFAGLIRMDDFGNPAVILAGSVYVTAGTTRRATGTHYTPRSLTEPIVEHTLEPLVYAGVAEGLPREQWTLRAPAELLALKVCDMAMGSAGFLVQVVRYLAERLVESIQNYEVGMMNSNSEFRIQISELGEEDKLIYARRLVAERCIYGVDKNPLAVEIAKLSLWLVTMAKERPFTFLDHALKCGDSLVGASKDDLLRWVHVVKDTTMSLWKSDVEGYLSAALEKRRELEGFVVRDVRDAERKEALLKEADAAMENVKRGADLLTGARLLGLKADALEALLENMIHPYAGGFLFGEIDAKKYPDAARALHAAQKERAFHWEFEFPEVFERGGFNAFVGNPPFLGGKRLATVLGELYQNTIKGLFVSSKGAADLCAYFYRRSFDLLKKSGYFGLIATNTIAQGDTREVGLDYLVISQKGKIFRAEVSKPWPGQAGVNVSIVWMRKGEWSSEYILDNNSVPGISSSLYAETATISTFSLSQNKGFISEGVKVHGLGFVLDPLERDELIAKNSHNNDVIKPYLIGDDFVNKPDQGASRFVINFRNWDENKCRSYPDLFDILTSRVKPYRDSLTKQIHESRYWLFWDRRETFFESIAQWKRVLVCSAITKHLAIAFVSLDQVISKQLKIFAFEDFASFAILQSEFHNLWARRKSSTFGDTLNYSNSDSFLTFPFPHIRDGLEQVGEQYHEHRRQIMLSRQEGLTSTYNRFHNPEEGAKDIVRLRELHVEMDEAVAAAYGWGAVTSDQSSVISEKPLELGHGFHETAQGVRFTVSESARREVLSRLLKLNHERYEEEQKAAEGVEGQTLKVKGGKGRKKSKSTDGQMGLL